MSRIRARFLTSICTVWPVTGTNDYGTNTYGSPYKFPCNFILGGKEQTDSTGEKFMPAATFRLQVVESSGMKADFIDGEYVITVDSISVIKVGAVIVNGDFTSMTDGAFDYPTPETTDQKGANRIRGIKRGTMLVGAEDVTVYT